VRAAIAALALLAISQPARAQEWQATARFGRVSYEGTPAGASGRSSAVLGLARAGRQDWLGASVALPFGEDPFWASLGAWRRLETRGDAGLLLDLSAHGFVQRQGATAVTGPAPSPGPLPLPSTPPPPTTIDRSGQGVAGELMAGGYAGSAATRFHARAGIAAQQSRLGNVSQRRALPTGDARLSLLLAPVTIQAESRAWLDGGVTRMYVGSTLRYAPGPFQLWGSLGGWTAGGIDRLPWSVGGAMAVASGVELQLGGRGNTFDPLYLTSTETSVWAGLTLRLHGGRHIAAPLSERARDGRWMIGIPIRSVKGAPSIAGDFTGWKPEPMQREGSRWIYSAILAPGVYRYAFVAEDGAWFVPESVPGRQDDGMGGHVAVLVVR
jgi:hypothetical protein